MTALGMVPAFRGADDAKEVRKNLESLDVGAKVLIDGHAMGIFPEGKSTDHAHLEMVRSGAARMALQAAEEGAKGVKVVPIGLIYQRREQFRSAVWVQVAEPIDVDALLEENEGNSRKARRALTTELDTRLRTVVVDLHEPEWEPWIADLEILYPPPVGSPKTPSGLLSHRKRIADAMNYFLETDRPRAELIAEHIVTYRDAVHAAGIRVDSIVLRRPAIVVAVVLLWKLLVLALLFLPAIWGTLYHIIPFILVRKIAARIDQPGLKTISTNRMLVGVPLYLLWYAIVTGGLLFAHIRIAWAALAIAPFVGVLAMYYWREARQTISIMYHQLRVLLGPSRLKQLKQQLWQLREQLGELADEFNAAHPKS